MRLCFLAYDAINTLVHAATDDRPGAAELLLPNVRRDIRRARREGADVIAVVPHWGTEYTTRVTPQQRRWARAMVRAGADIVLGAHSHVVGPIEFIDGVPVLYSLGDFLFDLPRFEETEEGVIVELTFQGDRLAQLELHPTVIVDRSQVALLDPAKDGQVVLQRMRAASRTISTEADPAAVHGDDRSLRAMIGVGPRSLSGCWAPGAGQDEPDHGQVDGETEQQQGRVEERQEERRCQGCQQHQ